MPIEIVLLTGEVEAPYLTEILTAENPYLVVSPAYNRAALERALDPPLYGRRLISFCSGVVVPAKLLACLDGPAYNFHPGPPTYPGRYPSRFAAYQGAREFGATVHEMVAKVDAGPIVAIDVFPVPPDATAERLDTMGFEACLRLFRQLAPHLANDDAPLPRIEQTWRGRKWRRADLDDLLTVTVDTPADEIARRRWLFADVRPCPIMLELHGHRFRLEAEDGPAPDLPG